MRVCKKWLGCILLAVCILLNINVGHAEQISTAVGQSEIKYKINCTIQKKYPELIQLILSSDAMDEHERQCWFDQLPCMSKIQIVRLHLILLVEYEEKNLESTLREARALKAEKERKANLSWFPW